MLNFSAFWKWFADDFSSHLTYETEATVFRELFAVYFEEKGGREIEIARLSAIKTNRENLPLELVRTYAQNEKNQKSLETAVQKHLMPNLKKSWPEAGEALVALIDCDPYIQPYEKEELMEGYVPDGSARTTAWLTKVLLYAMIPHGRDNSKSLRVVDHNYIPGPCKWFFGRSAEQKKIHEQLQKNKVLFLHGIPGIGKSELAKKFVATHKKKYTDIIWISCSKSLRHSIAELQLPCDRQADNEKIRFRNHLHIINHIQESGLVVLDNCNWLPEDEPLLDEIVKCKAHVLITTQTFAKDRNNLEVKEMDIADLLSVMHYFYQRKENFPERTMRLLIEKLHRHTYAVELVARVTAKDCPSPWAFLMKLSWQRFARDIQKTIRNQKDNKTQKASYYQTMHDLFALMNLDSANRELLRNMTLMPEYGVFRDALVVLLGLRDDEQVEELERMGLLRWDDKEFVVQMLPMVRDITLEELPPSIQNCGNLVNNISQRFGNYGADDIHCCMMYEIVDRIIEAADKDDMERYWLLLSNTFNNMEHMGHETAMHRIFEAIEAIKIHCRLGPVANADYLDMKACLEVDAMKRVEMEEEALRQLEFAGAGDSERAWNIVNNLAGAYRNAGCYAQAVKLFESRLKHINEEEHTSVSYNYLSCICSLAITYAEMGEGEEAVATILPVKHRMEAMKRACGSEYGLLLETLGHVYAVVRQTSKAMAAYEEALVAWIDLYGEQSDFVLEKMRDYRFCVCAFPEQRNVSEIALK